MATHQHRAIPERRVESCWSGCVVDTDAYLPDDERNHGNIRYEDYCKCGATRLGESNRSVRYGSWCGGPEEV